MALLQRCAGGVSKSASRSKDPGMQRYGKGKQLFCDQLDVLDGLFDSLPAPLPYNAVAHGPITLHPPSNMSRYRNVKSSCFAGHTRVQVVDPVDGTEKTIPIEKLGRGDIMKTPNENTRTVRAVVKCHTDQTEGRAMAIPINQIS